MGDREVLRERQEMFDNKGTIVEDVQEKIWSGMDPNSAVSGSDVSCPKQTKRD